MAVPRTPTENFKSEGTIRGIPYRTLALAVVLDVVPAILLSQVIAGIPWLLAIAGVLMLCIKIAEFLTQRIPPLYFPHLMEWLRTGPVMGITHDPSPVPLIVETQPEKHRL